MQYLIDFAQSVTAVTSEFHAYELWVYPIKLQVCHTSHNGDLARMNFRLKNDNTIDLDYPCALQNTLVFGL